MVYSVALIGCGKMGSGYDEGRDLKTAPPYSHAGALSQHPDFELVALADSDEAKLAASGERWGVMARYPDPQSLFSALQPDVAIIATPSTIRLSVIKAALEAGVKAIICEKPLALNGLEAQQILTRCAFADVPLLLNFSRRWDSAAQTAATISAELGQIEYVRGLFVGDIKNNGGHLIDLIRWWTGVEIKAVESINAHFEQIKAVQFSLSNGASGELRAIKSYDIFELDLFFEGGRIRLSESGYKIEIQRRQAANALAGMPTLSPSETLPSGLDFALMRMLDNLAGVLRGEAQPLCDGADGLAVSRAFDLIMAAALKR